MQGIDLMKEITEKETEIKKGILKGKLVKARNKLRIKRQEVTEFEELLIKAKNERDEAEKAYGELMKMNVVDVELPLSGPFDFDQAHFPHIPNYGFNPGFEIPLGPTYRCFQVVAGKDIEAGEMVHYVE